MRAHLRAAGARPQLAEVPICAKIRPCIASSPSPSSRWSPSTSRSPRRCSGARTRTSGATGTSSPSAPPRPGRSRPRPASTSSRRSASRRSSAPTRSSVPGFNPQEERLPDGVADALRAAHARGARIVSVCTGAFALADAGLLDGRRATTHWADAAELARRYPAVEVDDRVLFVDHGDVATSAGVAAGIDLCLQLVRADHGAGVAAAIARRMVVAPYREGSQAQFIDRPAAGADRRPGRDARVGARAARATADRGRDGGPRRLERALVRASLPRRDGHDAAALAARAARRRGAAAAGAERAGGRRRRARARASAPPPRCGCTCGGRPATTPTAHRRAFTRARPAASPGRAGRPAAAPASPWSPAGHARARRTPRTPPAPG